jgi:protein-tyrosine phosphatase
MGNTLDKITPHLWLGDKESVKDNASPNVKVIVTAITQQELDEFGIAKTVQERGVEWHWISADDDEKEPLENHFHRVHDILTAAEKADKVALVHCAAGISRSATLVIAHLMLRNKWTYTEAFVYVQKCRPIVTPNDGFVKALKALERQIQMGDPL